MELVMPVVLILCFLGLAFAIQGSTAPSPSTSGLDSARQVLPGSVSAPSLAVEPNVNFNNSGSSPALSPSFVGKGIGNPIAAPSIERHDPISPVNKSPPLGPYFSPKSAPMPSTVRKRDGMPSAAPPIPGVKPPTSHSPTKEPGIPFRFAPPPSIVSERDGMPAAAPRYESPEPVLLLPPVDHSPIRAPSITRKKGAIPVAAPASRKFDLQRPANTSPIEASPQNVTCKRDAMPVAAPPSKRLEPQPPMNHYPSTWTGISPASKPPPSLAWRRHVMPSAAPVSMGLGPVRPMHHFSTKDIAVSPAPTPTPTIGQKRDGFPKASFPNKHPKPPTPTNHPPNKDTASSPTALPKSRRKHYTPAPLKPGSSVISSRSPITSPTSDVSPTPSLSPEAPSGHSKMPYQPPKGDSSRTPKALPVVQALPPPPPNTDCSSTTCTEPYTNSPPGSPCACVLPIQVALLLGIDLYTFFPLVSELATEVSAGIFMKQSQVRITGANAASQRLEKTIVLVDLVPLGEKFDATTAFLTFERFWHKKVPIRASIFGDYEVLYLHYPGLPPSPPIAPSDINMVDGGPYSGSGNNGRNVKPLGVDVRKRQYKNGLGGGVIAIIVLSATVAVLLLSAAAWVFLFKQRDNVSQREPPRALLSSLTKSSAALGSMIESGASFASLSIESNIAPYTGSAKTFSTSDVEIATDNYNPSRILGEGGFGRVYLGLLEDGTKVAVKVLKRDDQQGSREFLAEIEMLSRLHHRNLVKLIGICIEEQNRCLVYELIPNGSVESHLHGIDKETSPLDWTARIKIALGAARGLSYLHEDSSPHVIHRDFKSSNILLEDDFTPKVSDFGLARTAMDEENRHISTRVMGTFGYVAPEYAMTGHLLVKSDVYSYGVVLLELLTGKKPVDMSQAPGQENLVAWARPLLTSKEGLEAIIDPSLEPDVPFDSISKVAAIASMCVQPEVSNRPFMGEVVQALKLVCNECEESYEVDSGRTSECGDLSIDMEASMSNSSEQQSKHLPSQFSHSTFEPESDPEHRLSLSDLLSTSTRLGRLEPGSFRRNSSSSPLRTGRSRQFWQKVRRMYGGSVSEHSTISKFWHGYR